MKITVEFDNLSDVEKFCAFFGGKPAPVSDAKPDSGKVKALTESKDLKAAPKEETPVVKGDGKEPDADPRLVQIKEIGVSLSDKRMDGVRALLTKYKIGKFSELKPEQLDEFLDKITKMKAADDDKYNKMLAALKK